MAPLLGIPAFLGAGHLIRFLGRAHARLAEAVLGPQPPDEVVRRAERAEEQVRIDQELHDSIGHVLTMNVVQAGAASHVFDSNPEFARQALHNIERRGRQALEELDWIINLVRSGPGERHPVAHHRDIGTLLAEAEAAGIDVAASIDDVDAPPVVSRAAYQTVREALTNLARHAPGAPAAVTLSSNDSTRRIRVTNGPAESPHPGAGSGSGSGLVGIRDRVTLLGGTFVAEPTPAGGFMLEVTIPLNRDPQTEGSKR